MTMTIYPIFLSSSGERASSSMPPYIFLLFSFEIEGAACGLAPHPFCERNCAHGVISSSGATAGSCCPPSAFQSLRRGYWPPSASSLVFLSFSRCRRRLSGYHPRAQVWAKFFFSKTFSKLSDFEKRAWRPGSPATSAAAPLK